MHLMYYLDEKGCRVYSLKVKAFPPASSKRARGSALSPLKSPWLDHRAPRSPIIVPWSQKAAPEGARQPAKRAFAAGPSLPPTRAYPRSGSAEPQAPGGIPVGSQGADRASCRAPHCDTVPHFKVTFTHITASTQKSCDRFTGIGIISMISCIYGSRNCRTHKILCPIGVTMRVVLRFCA